MTGVGIARMVVFRQMNDAYQSLQEIDPDNDHLRLAMPDERADISVIYEYAKSLRKETARKVEGSREEIEEEVQVSFLLTHSNKTGIQRRLGVQ